MNKYNMKLLFILACNRNNKKIKCDAKCRITQNKERKQFSTGQFINPKNWNGKQQILGPPEPEDKLVEIEKIIQKKKQNNQSIGPILS